MGSNKRTILGFIRRNNICDEAGLFEYAGKCANDQKCNLVDSVRCNFPFFCLYIRSARRRAGLYIPHDRREDEEFDDLLSEACGGQNEDSSDHTGVWGNPQLVDEIIKYCLTNKVSCFADFVDMCMDGKVSKKWFNSVAMNPGLVWLMTEDKKEHDNSEPMSA